MTQGDLLPFAREVIDVPVDDELGESFLAYSLSVITSRAIPDVRDGLKPVQRRILYSMQEMNLRPDRSHRKCGRVVGDVLGKYHPHGDAAIYDTLVRLGQDFARSVTLVDPQGNFGTLDDPPAAARYTECRLTEAALDLLAEIDEETVEWRPTYDGDATEPAYLPGLLPNLLVNGTSGIAVGMATNMATHNLGEIYEAIKLVMTKRRPKPTIDELLAVVAGPDFPSGGIVIDDGIREAYDTGRGAIRIRAKAEVINVTRARKGLEITELPYMVGPERVITKIKDLVNSGRLQGISDVKNLSDRNAGLRLVIECKTGVNPVRLLTQLYRLTPLEESFGINNVVLVDGVPTTLGLYDLCWHYIEHRLDVVVKRSEFRLRKATEQLHLVEGLLIAIDNIDEVVAIIRSSADTSTARTSLMERLDLSEAQANYVLELRLRRLTALAYDELVEQKTELETTIADLRKILDSEKRRRTIVLNELGAIVERYGKPRKTRIISATEAAAQLVAGDGDGDGDTSGASAVADAKAEAGPPDTPCMVSLTNSGLVGREPQGTSKSYSPSRHDVVSAVVTTTLRQPVVAITASGKLQRATAADLPEVGGRSRGRSAIETFDADRDDSIVTISAGSPNPLLVVTALGFAKRLGPETLTELGAGRQVISLAANDRVVAAFEAGDADEVVLVSSDAQVLRTPVEAIRVQGPTAKGVATMKVKGQARVTGAGLASAAANSVVIVSVTDRGTAKVTAVGDVPTKGRGGAGVRLTKFSDEQRLDLAWIGSSSRAMCVVSQSGSTTRPDNTPQPLTLRPTRRDGPSTVTPARILGVGSPRW